MEEEEAEGNFLTTVWRSWPSTGAPPRKFNCRELPLLHSRISDSSNLHHAGYPLITHHSPHPNLEFMGLSVPRLEETGSFNK